VRIQITGRHVGVTEAMKDYAREKVQKLERLYDRMTGVEVTMEGGSDRKVVEMVAEVGRGVRLVGKAESPDMYAAVDLAEEKLGRQLVRHKQKLTDHHRGRESMGSVLPGAVPPTGGPGPAREETYEEIVERMKEQDDES
jgi:putative sigma-54 modulation protein